MQYVLLLVLYYIPSGCILYYIPSGSMHYTCRCLHYHLAGFRFIRQTRLCYVIHTLVLRITTSVSCSTCPNPSYV